MIKAEIVCDSISPQGKRLTTFKIRYPWFIHGELMTHRVLSRNASSNRAIPLKKMLEEVRSDDLRAEPVYWGAEQKGMEPGGELDNTKVFVGTCTRRERAQEEWRMAALRAADHAECLGNVGLHKSLCNRLLMPFTHANVVVTATEWDNFFGLRLDKAADPTMRALAVAMWEIYDIHGPGKGPQLLEPGQWHLPFVNVDDLNGKDYLFGENLNDILIKVSVARCARVSYESHDTGKRSTVEEDLKLYDRLVGAQPLHASPAEHQATPDEPLFEYWSDSDGSGFSDKVQKGWKNQNQHANFVGWCQYRKMLIGEAIAPLPKEYRA